MKTKSITIRISGNTYSILKKMSKKVHENMSTLIRIAINEYIMSKWYNSVIEADTKDNQTNTTKTNRGLVARSPRQTLQDK